MDHASNVSIHLDTLDVWVHWMYGYIISPTICYTVGVHNTPKEAAVGHFEKKTKKSTKRYTHNYEVF